MASQYTRLGTHHGSKGRSRGGQGAWARRVCATHVARHPRAVAWDLTTRSRRRRTRLAAARVPRNLDPDHPNHGSRSREARFAHARPPNAGAHRPAARRVWHAAWRVCRVGVATRIGATPREAGFGARLLGREVRSKVRSKGWGPLASFCSSRAGRQVPGSWCSGIGGGGTTATPGQGSQVPPGARGQPLQARLPSTAKFTPCPASRSRAPPPRRRPRRSRCG